MNVIEILNEILTKYEGLWLFLILTLETMFTLYTSIILTIEYWYDKNFNEAIKKARRERRRKNYERSKTLQEDDGEIKTLTTGEMK